MDTKRLTKIAVTIESAINTALSMDPAAQKHLKRLRDCVLAISVSSPSKVIYVGVEEQNEAQRNDSDDNTQVVYRVAILPAQDHSSVQIKGSLLSFIKLASSKDKSLLFKTNEIQLSGESVRIQQIQAFLSIVSVDWEGILASVIGDIPAHIIGTSIRQSLSFGKNLTQSLIRDAEEFIKYELRLFPNKAAAKKQFSAIDKLYQASEALEKKIKARLGDKSNQDSTVSQEQTTN